MRLYILFSAVLIGCAGSVGSLVVDPSLGNLVHRYTQSEQAGQASCYWFDTPSGPVMVDVPLRPAEAKKLQSILVRPLRIYVTAARADRFGTLTQLSTGEVPVFSSPAVADEIKQHGDSRLALSRRRDSSVPAHVEPPRGAVEERTRDVVGDVEVELLPLGPAESENSLAVYLPKTGELITGDVVVGHQHLDLTWGRSVEWQARVEELKHLSPRVVYPGHGSPGGPELLDQTLTYLKFIQGAVGEYVKAGAPERLAANDFSAIKRKVLAQFPLLGRPELLDRSIAAIYAVELGKLQPAVPEPAKADAKAASKQIDDLLSAGKAKKKQK